MSLSIEKSFYRTLHLCLIEPTFIEITSNDLNDLSVKNFFDTEKLRFLLCSFNILPLSSGICRENLPLELELIWFDTIIVWGSGKEKPGMMRYARAI